MAIEKLMSQCLVSLAIGWTSGKDDNQLAPYQKSTLDSEELPERVLAVAILMMMCVLRKKVIWLLYFPLHKFLHITTTRI